MQTAMDLEMQGLALVWLGLIPLIFLHAGRSDGDRGSSWCWEAPKLQRAGLQHT